MAKELTPFEIVRADGHAVASNGTVKVVMFDDEGGRLFKRRAVGITTAQPAGEATIPRLNALSQYLLDNPGTTPEAVSTALRELAEAIAPTPQSAPKAEWAVAELSGVRVYVTDEAVIVTKRDMYP